MTQFAGALGHLNTRTYVAIGFGIRIVEIPAVWAGYRDELELGNNLCSMILYWQRQGNR